MRITKDYAKLRKKCNSHAKTNYKYREFHEVVFGSVLI